MHMLLQSTSLRDLSIRQSYFHCFPDHRCFLNRNLLYTAVTRARKCVTVVGKEETFAEMIRNEKQQKRYSALDERIRELSETTGDNNTDGEE